MRLLSKPYYMKVTPMLTEGAETRNMSAAKHYLYDKMGLDEAGALNVIGMVKHDIPNSRLAKCKFMLGLVRMLIDGQLSDAQVMFSVNTSLKIAASNAHINEYNQDLNGMTASQFVSRFATFVKQDLENDRKEVASQSYNEAQSVYDIVKIDSFETAQQYQGYVEWCVTNDESMYNQYTHLGTGVFYFCLRRGFENVPRKQGENCPLDEYGLSMIAVCINSDGSCNAITCRWNHNNHGSDTVMTPKQLSSIINRNFYETFKPLTPEEIAEAKARIMEELSYEISELLDYHGSLADFCEGVGEEYDDGEAARAVEKSGNPNLLYPFYIYESDETGMWAILNQKAEIVGDDVFDNVTFGRTTLGTPLFFVLKGNNVNILKTDGTYVSEKWYDRIQVPKFDTRLRNSIDIFQVADNIDGKTKWNLMDINGKILLQQWFNALDTYILHGRYTMVFFGGESYGNNSTMNSSMNYMDIQTQKFVFNKNISDFKRANGRDVFVKLEGDDYYMCYSTSNFTLRAPWKFTAYSQGYDGYTVKDITGHMSSYWGYIIKLLDDGVEYILGDIVNYDLLRGENDGDDGELTLDNMVIVKKNPYNSANGPYGPNNIVEAKTSFDDLILEAIHRVVFEKYGLI